MQCLIVSKNKMAVILRFPIVEYRCVYMMSLFAFQDTIHISIIHNRKCLDLSNNSLASWDVDCYFSSCFLSFLMMRKKKFFCEWFHPFSIWLRFQPTVTLHDFTNCVLRFWQLTNITTLRVPLLWERQLYMYVVHYLQTTQNNSIIFPSTVHVTDILVR